MIYTEVDPQSAAQVTPIQSHVDFLTGEIEHKRQLANKSDSKSLEARLRAEVVTLKREKRLCQSEIENIKTETFKNLLAEEYNLPRTHPKFDKVYDFVYSNFHGNGFGDVEIYFGEVVAILKD